MICTSKLQGFLLERPRRGAIASLYPLSALEWPKVSSRSLGSGVSRTEEGEALKVVPISDELIGKGEALP